MNSLRVLFFDDNQEDYESVWKRFSFYWKQYYDSIELIHNPEIDYMNKTEEVFDILASDKFNYQLCLVDLLAPSTFSSGKENIGESVIKEIRKKSNCIIVAISIGNNIEFPELEKETVKEEGADYFVPRQYLKKEEKYKLIYDFIIEKCLERNIIKDSIKLDHNQEPKINYIISEIGENNIKSLYKQVLPRGIEIEGIKANYLTPGLSGAYVLQMNVDEKNKGTASHLLKINRDKKILLREINNRPILGRYSPKLFINYLQIDEDKCPYSDNWYAIGAEFASNTSTLRDWLNFNTNQSDVSFVLENVFFNEGMSIGYSNPRLVASTIPTDLNLSESRIARILISLEELKEVCLHKELGKDSNWEVKSDKLRDFLINKNVFNIDKNLFPNELFICQCHGDFHARNILVNKNGKPFPTIIDTAEFGPFHWATDYVRLTIDFLLSSFDFGVSSHLWDRLPKWLTISKSFIELKEITYPQISRNSLLIAINWMTRNLGKLFPFVSTERSLQEYKWELQLSMAIEFLRGAYRVDITVPKRVLALQSAYFALEEAENSFKNYIIAH